jgi:hypothetical protein
MKISHILIIIFGAITFLACNFSGNKANAQPDTIVKIKIINGTPNHYIKSDTSITNPDDIAQFSQQFKRMKEVFDTNIQYNHGSYEIEVFYKNGNKNTIDVIYTVFDGVVIADENTSKRYKNNEMDNLMLFYLRKK